MQGFNFARFFICDACSRYVILMSLSLPNPVITLQYFCPSPVESRAVTITTYAKDRIQRRSNSSNSPRDEYELVQEKVYYTQAPESVVIKVSSVVSWIRKFIF